MSVTCPAGHRSASTDYCDTCGAPISATQPVASVVAAAPAAAAAAEPVEPAACPNCGAARGPGEAFCEVCGLDFATGQLPAPPPAPPPATAPATADWVAVIEADRAFFETNESPETGIPFPAGRSSRQVPLTGDQLLIGRRSDTRGIFPDIDLGGTEQDPGVSRRHAVLRRKGDGQWVVVDQASTNGTWVRGASLGAGEEAVLQDGDHVHVGAWTRITLRRTSGG